MNTWILITSDGAIYSVNYLFIISNLTKNHTIPISFTCITRVLTYHFPQRTYTLSQTGEYTLKKNKKTYCHYAQRWTVPMTSGSFWNVHSNWPTPTASQLLKLHFLFVLLYLLRTFHNQPAYEQKYELNVISVKEKYTPVYWNCILSDKNFFQKFVFHSLPFLYNNTMLIEINNINYT